MTQAEGYPPSTTFDNTPGKFADDLEIVIGYFLSRLCGGKQRPKPINSAEDFLSRLCGGKLRHFLDDSAAVFLSRLCGGKLSRGFKSLHPEFLSRLCGGKL